MMDRWGQCRADSVAVLRVETAEQGSAELWTRRVRSLPCAEEPLSPEHQAGNGMAAEGMGTLNCEYGPTAGSDGARAATGGLPSGLVMCGSSFSKRCLFPALSSPDNLERGIGYPPNLWRPELNLENKRV